MPGENIEVKELIIIGAGPAGITAAVYAARKKLDFSVVSFDIGGQAAWSGDIENYTGYQFITGPDLAEKFRQHLSSFNFDLQVGVGAAKIERGDGLFKVATSDGKALFAKTVIIAAGKKPRLLNVPGEQEYKNRGVTYCATCDGPLFNGKAVAIIGGGNSALDAALQMSKIAAKVYLLNINEGFDGEEVLQDKVLASPNIEVLYKMKVLEIFGDKFVKGLKVDVDGRQKELAVEGVFIEVGLTPNSEIIDFVKKNDLGEIIVNGAAETNVPGIFAAGDITNVFEKQIIIAAGEGSKAALSAARYLSTH